VIIHHVKVDEIRTGIDDSSDFLAQLREVCGKNTRGDAIVSHEGHPLVEKLQF
jgi:hypothetical protein